MSPADQESPGRNRRAVVAESAMAGAVVAGAFCLVVAAMMAWNLYRLGDVNLLESNELTPLKEALARNPRDDAARGRLRQIDRRLRTEYFQRRDFSHKGAYLLLAGAAAAIVMLQVRSQLREKAPGPPTTTEGNDRARRAARLGRWSVAIVTAALCASALAWAVSGGTEADLTVLRGAAEGPKDKPQPPPAPPPPPAAGATAEEIAKSWPRFRGPGGGAVWPHANVPTSWDGPSGRGIAWKSPVPLPGKNSPIICGDRIFLTGADAKRREVYCFDTRSGKLVWKRVVAIEGGPAEAPEVMEDTGFAATTAATDGRHVFAMFANGDLACFDFNGRQLWAKNLGLPENMYGHAASLATWEDSVIIQFDQAQAEDGKSELLAMAGDTGDLVWVAAREVANSWSSPIVVRAAGRDQIITAANPWVVAYDPVGGNEIWRAKCLSGDVGPSPIFAGGLVFAVNTEPALVAIRPDGKRNVTASHVLWRGEDGLPEICSPVSDGKLVWLLASFGQVTCYQAKDGKLVYEKDLEASFTASPSLAGGKLYLLSEKGVTFIVEATREFKLFETNKLGEAVHASPAFAEGRIYARAKKNLYCIEQSPGGTH